MDVLQKVSRALADRYDIRVVFRGSQAHTDGTVITLPAMSENPSHKDKMMARGYNGHERGHISHTDFNVLKRTFGNGPVTSEAQKLHTTWNYLEDLRIERKVANEYVGEKQNMQYVANEIVKNTKTNMNHPYMWLFVEGRRKVCEYELEGPSYESEVKKLFGADIFDRIAALNSTEEAMALARELVKIYDDFKDQQEQEPEQSGGQGNQGGSVEQQDGRPGDCDDQSENQEGPDGAGKNKNDDENGEESDHGSGDQDDTGDKKEEEDGQGSGVGKGKQGGADENDKSDGDGKGDEPGDKRPGYGDTFQTNDGTLPHLPGISDAPDPFDGVRKYLERAHDKVIASGQDYIVYDKSEDTLKPMSSARDNAGYDRLKKELGVFNVIRGKVQNLFMARTQSRWLGGKEEGKLNAKALARVKSGYKDVFREKVVSKDRDTAVTFLCDFSGSMLGGKLRSAMKSVVLLLECLEGTKIKTEVLTYTTVGDIAQSAYRDYSAGKLKGYGRVEPILMTIIKGFGESYGNKVKRRIGNWEKQQHHNNADGDSLLVAYERLLARKEQRRILIVLSDGIVNTEGADNALGRAYLLKLTNRIQRERQVELLCFALEAKECKRYYPKVIDISNAPELPSFIFTELRKILKV